MKDFQPQQINMQTSKIQTQSKVKSVFLELGELSEEGGEIEIERNVANKLKNSRTK